jgi:hypothetical protein
MIASHHLGSFRHCDLKLTPNHLRTNGNQELWHALLVPVMEFMELCNGNMLKRCLWTSVFWSPVTVLQLCQSVGTMIFVVLQMRVSRVSQGSKNQQVTSHKYHFSWFPPSVFLYFGHWHQRFPQDVAIGGSTASCWKTCVKFVRFLQSQHVES